MKQTSARQENSADAGFGFADAIVGVVILALAVLVAGSILASAATAVERVGGQLRAELEARRESFER